MNKWAVNKCRCGARDDLSVLPPAKEGGRPRILEEPEIVSLCPADGWLAEYDVDGKPNYDPVACWAVVILHHPGGCERYVRGLTPEDGVLNFACEATNFVRYKRERPAP